MKTKSLTALAISVILAAGTVVPLAACSSCDHVLDYYPEVAATCVEDGHCEYWQCEKCGKYFKDADATKETDYESIVLQSKGKHSYVQGDYHEATCSEAGYWEQECSVCGDTTPKTDTANPALGHIFTDDSEYCERCGHTRIDYTLSDDGTYYIVTGLNDTTITDVVIPSEHTALGDETALPVKAIGDKAFQNQYKITSVSFPDSVTSIGAYAFYNCQALTEISIPGCDIGSFAFAYCKAATSVTIGNEAPVCIGQSAFASDTSLETVTFEGEVASVGKKAFEYCTALKSISITGSAEEIGADTFYECKSLTSVSLGSSLKTIGENAFFECSSLASITFPDGLETIGDDAFMYCDALESITIPDSVTNLGFGVFYLCTGLKNVTIGSGVTLMANSVFFGCKSLESVTFKVTTGWSVSDLAWGSTQTPVYTAVDSSSLTGPSTAAETVREYEAYRWVRS
ncbi:MAG: leucine-rich repeat domain-containing protein [Clostridia bacterium]|nr:leucine-rich repeat domain-containing protein [Clostridia bacterium]